MMRNQSNAARSLAPGHTEQARIEEERELLLRAVGHELRSPLTAISLGIDLMQRDSPSKARILTVMKSTVQRMDRLIDELLRFACSDAGEATPQREGVSFHVRLLKHREGSRPRDEEKGGRR